jgi:hypothetical protein
MRAPILGETLFALPIGYSARQRERTLIPVTVSKVGRKYFTCKLEHFDVEFHLDTWRQKTDYSNDWSLYASKGEWESEKEANAIEGRLREVFKYGSGTKLSLETLRKINALVFATEAAEQQIKV